MSLGILFPGQGSQKVGMLEEFISKYPIVSQTFEEASDILSTNLLKIIKKGPVEKINDTENTQPIMFCAGYSIWKIWKEEGGENPIFFAGHSFGEYTALLAASVFTFKDGIKLVSERAKLMKKAPHGKMFAIIGLSVDDISKIVEPYNDVSIANINAPTQIVISGAEESSKKISEAATKAGAKKVIELPVSIAAHSILMKESAVDFDNFLQKFNFKEPQIPVVNNVDVMCEKSETNIKDSLVRQLYSSVQWVNTIEYMEQQGVNTLIELGPGNILNSLNKRIDNSIQSFNISDSKGLDRVFEEIN